jgi:hypothetical protein
MTELSSTEDQAGTDVTVLDVTVSDVPEMVVPALVDVDPLSEDQARQLTETIRDASEVMWVLLARAHAGQAWQALGYPSWEAYVRGEFDMSRSRSYQILDQARVISAISAAVPEGTPIHLTEASARDLKGKLDQVIPEVAARTADLDPDSAGEVLAEVLADLRHSPAPALTGGSAADDDDEGFFSDVDPEQADWEASGGSGDLGGSLPAGSGAPRPAAAALLGDTGDRGGHGEPEPDLPDVDVASIRRYVNATHDVYSSLTALAGLPAELEEIIAIIPPVRAEQIDATIEEARLNLERFAELWADRQDGSV